MAKHLLPAAEVWLSFVRVVKLRMAALSVFEIHM